MDNGCPQCIQVEGLCPDCEIEMLEADIGRSMKRIEELKEKKGKHEFSNVSAESGAMVDAQGNGYQVRN
mgnify:CR=1 FL=1